MAYEAVAKQNEAFRKRPALCSRRISMSLSVVSRFMIYLAVAAATLPGLDLVRVETRSDQASSQYGVSGKGVIYAMIDRGIDWQNNDFRNADGTTRIAYIFELSSEERRVGKEQGS